jgi:ribosomal protein L10
MATIPSREGLYTQFVGMLNETIARVVRVIDQKAKVA